MDKPQISKILLSQEDIGSIVAQLARQINADYHDLESELMVIGLLKGSFIFMADLVRQLDMPLVLDFMAVSSYGDGVTSSENVRFLMDLQTSVAGRDLLVVEDIVDTGRTLERIVCHLYNSQPKSLKVCTLLDKPARRQVEVSVDYVGLKIPDEFVCGYGLDFAQKFRNLPYIGVLKP